MDELELRLGNMLGKAQGLFPNSEAKGKSSEKALNETPNSELRHDTFDAMVRKIHFFPPPFLLYFASCLPQKQI